MCEVSVSDVTSHDALADAFQRLGKTFIGGVTDSRFGAPHLKLQLQNVSRLQHIYLSHRPSNESFPFGKLKSQHVSEEFRCLIWINLVKNVSKFGRYLCCNAVGFNRTKPVKKNLVWHQIGVFIILYDKFFLLFTERLSLHHLLTDKKSIKEIIDIESKWTEQVFIKSESGISSDNVMETRDVKRLDRKLSCLIQAQAPHEFAP